MKIRAATIEDLPAIMKVESLGFIKEIQEDAEVFKKRIEVCPSLFLVFEEVQSKTVAGYLCAEYLDHIPQNSQELQLGHNPQVCKAPEEKYIYISSFSILPEFRGNGNGKRLWNQSLELLGKNSTTAKGFILLVNELWQGAFHIYENSGFKIVKRFKDFFPSNNGDRPSDGILMIKN